MTTDIAIVALLLSADVILAALAYRLWVGPWLRQRRAAKRPFNVRDFVVSPY